MSFTTIKSKWEAFEKGWVHVHVKLTTGATGAVSVVDGKGFNDGAPTGELGGIVRDDVGDYTITLPGRGGLQDISLLADPVIVDGSASDVRHCLVTAITPASRTVAVTFLDADTPAATDPANGSVIHFHFLAKDGSVQ